MSKALEFVGAEWIAPCAIACLMGLSLLAGGCGHSATASGSSTGSGSNGDGTGATGSTGSGTACSTDSCAGCCDDSGKCELPTPDHCGLDGAACAACASGQGCASGACADVPGTSSASSSGSTTSGSSGASSTGAGSTGSTGGGAAAASTGSTGSGGCCLALNCPGACDPAACACVSGDTGSTGGTTGTTGAPDAGGLCSTQRCAIYAETPHTLYQVDPNPPNAITELCNFGGDIHPDAGVNDIAVEPNGTLWGITKTDLYKIDISTCVGIHITALVQTANGFNCLTFTDADTLLAADEDGKVLTVNTATGAVTDAGSFGSNLGCSGDILSIANGTLYATAKTLSGPSTTDVLVTLDPSNGYAATPVSSAHLGYSSVYGLADWGGTLYGFDVAGQILSIDPTAGTATLVRTESGASFYGAGVTPLAPISPTH